MMNPKKLAFIRDQRELERRILREQQRIREILVLENLPQQAIS